tara:strand:- start:525 stop:788 length:264 start_codon:yes stop_codon:yes gene_type:complete
MPTYTYKCDKCELVFEKFHSMSEAVEHCECDPASTVQRVISKTSVIRKNRSFGEKKPGSVVKKYIEDVKDEVRKEKRRIRNQEYEIK